MLGIIKFFFLEMSLLYVGFIMVMEDMLIIILR